MKIKSIFKMSLDRYEVISGLLTVICIAATVNSYSINADRKARR